MNTPATYLKHLTAWVTLMCLSLMPVLAQSGTPQSLFTSQIPVSANANYLNTNYELGMKFQSGRAGQITALRYWKSVGDTGSHLGKIWAVGGGTALATVLFTNETASGWQQQTLSMPLTISANTIYIVSVNTTAYYPVTVDGLTSAVINGDLTSIADGNNGVYDAPGNFPVSSYQGSNYFRDVIFVAASTNATRVNAGGTTYTDTLGNLWLADTGFLGGKAYTTTKPIANTSNPTIYQSARGSKTFSYLLNAANGAYTLNLHFAEFAYNKTGQRTFNVSAEGVQILSNFDIIAAAGGARKAIIKTFPVTIDDGKLDLSLSGVIDSARLSGIELIPVGLSTLAKISGDNQTVTVGQTASLGVQVNNSSGIPQPGVVVTFVVTAGGGTVSATSVITDANGQAISQLTLGTSAGTNTVAASAPGLGNVTFTATGIAAIPAKLALSPATVSTSPGSNVSYQVKVQDQYGNTVTNATTTITFTVTSSSGSFSPAQTTAVAGLATTTFVPSTTGTATITATASNLTSATSTITAVAVTNATLRINTGGNLYTDTLGGIWSVDTGFTGGNTYSNTNPITNTNNPTLYQSERWGIFNYGLPVANGSYTLNLHFAEIFFTTAGKRIFNVSAEGNPILNNFDIVASAGAGNTALIQSFPITITDGQLDLAFTAVVDTPKISAIELIPNGSVASITIISGNAQTNSAGSTLTSPLVVQVKNSAGIPQSGITVVFAPSSGSVAPASATTDANGQATTQLTLGTKVGLTTISATASSFGGVTFSATATPGAVSKLMLTPASSRTIPGRSITYQASLSDQYDNLVTSTSSPISFAVSGVTGDFSLPNPLTPTAGSVTLSFTPTTIGTATITASASGVSSGTAQLGVSTANPVVLENQQPGTTAWKINNWATNNEIAGYASATSVNKGSSLDLKIALANTGTYTINIYRLGYYGGNGGRLMLSTGVLSGQTQLPCQVTDTTTQLIECNWSTSYTLAVGNTWTSGLYLANLTDQATGKQSQIWFVVRDDSRASDILFQSGFSTYLAYNEYGGLDNGSFVQRSLYGYSSTNGQPAYKVSLDRPFAQTTTRPLEYNSILYWERNMARWLESQGYDVSYATSLDVHTTAGLLLTHRTFLSVGHDEYWSLQMRNNVEAARDAGINLSFFSGNTAYWRVRFEPSSTGQDNRVMVGYKDAYTLDPVYQADATQATNRWRELPTNRPENALLGVMYVGENNNLYGGFDFVVSNSSDAYYAHTGLKDGDVFSKLVGYEWDAAVVNSVIPTGLNVLSQSLVYPTGVVPGYPLTTTQISNAARYTAASGAKVFAAGSIQWVWGLDSDGVAPARTDVRAQQMTVNILADQGAKPSLPDATLYIP